MEHYFTPTPTSAPSAPTPDTPQEATTRRRQRTPRTPQNLIRKAVRTATTLQTLPTEDHTLLAAILQTSPNLPDITAALLTTRNPQNLLTDITTLINAQPTERAITYLTMEKTARRHAWNTLHALGALTNPQPPYADAKAATTLAHAPITQTHRDRITTITQHLEPKQ